MSGIDDLALTADLWRELGGATELASLVEIDGPRAVLPSVFAVTELACASVALATLAVAELHAARRGDAPARVRVDRAHAALAFRRELYATPVGWELPPLWDPIAGDYAHARRLDPPAHQLRAPPRRRRCACSAFRRDARRRSPPRSHAGRGDALEQAVVDAGGCAAAMRDRDAWRGPPAGRRGRRESRCSRGRGAVAGERAAAAAAPRAAAARGVRVLDLTRVIAGPDLPRGFLAAYGADVLRIDPPGFAEVPRPAPRDHGRQAPRAARSRAPAGRERFDDAARAARTCWSRLPAGRARASRLRRGEPARAEPGARDRRARRLRLDRPLVRTARLRQPRADEHRHRRARAGGARERASGAAAGAGARPRHRLPDGGRRRAARSRGCATAASRRCARRWRAPRGCWSASATTATRSRRCRAPRRSSPGSRRSRRPGGRCAASGCRERSRAYARCTGRSPDRSAARAPAGTAAPEPTAERPLARRSSSARGRSRGRAPDRRRRRGSPSTPDAAARPRAASAPVAARPRSQRCCSRKVVPAARTSADGATSCCHSRVACAPVHLHAEQAEARGGVHAPAGELPRAQVVARTPATGGRAATASSTQQRRVDDGVFGRASSVEHHRRAASRAAPGRAPAARARSRCAPDSAASRRANSSIGSRTRGRRRPRARPPRSRGAAAARASSRAARVRRQSEARARARSRRSRCGCDARAAGRSRSGTGRRRARRAAGQARVLGVGQAASRAASRNGVDAEREGEVLAVDLVAVRQLLHARVEEHDHREPARARRSSVPSAASSGRSSAASRQT